MSTPDDKLTSKRQRFRAILDSDEMAVVPGAYDALSARIIECEGYGAVFAGGYAANASLLAEPDFGQSNIGDYADHYARIVAAVSVPVFVDGDTGFGSHHNVRHMTKRFEAAGVAGFFFSDQVFPNRCGYMDGASLISPEEMVSHIHVAVAARQDSDLVIVARTDALRTVGLDEAIRRACLYKSAGADATFVVGTDTIEDFQRVNGDVPGAQIANISHANPTGSASLDAYQAAGAAMAIFPSATLFAAAGAVRNALRTLSATRSFESVESAFMSLDDFYETVRFDDLKRIEANALAAGSKLLDD